MDIAEFLINDSLENRIHDFRVSKGTQIGIFINHNHKGTRERIEIGKYVAEAFEGRGERQYPQFGQQTSERVYVFLHGASDAFIVNNRLNLPVQRFFDQAGFPDPALAVHERSAAGLLHGIGQF